MENVSEEELIEGDMQTIKEIFPLPESESLNALVNLEFLKGMWVLFLSINADMQCPKELKDPLMLVSSDILISLSSGDKSKGILYFSLPAKSTIFSYKKSKRNWYLAKNYFLLLLLI